MENPYGAAWAWGAAGIEIWTPAFTFDESQIDQLNSSIKAMFLLKSTNMRIEEISAAVGYDNKSYFHRVFYSKTGLTPRNYRLYK